MTGNDPQPAPSEELDDAASKAAESGPGKKEQDAIDVEHPGHVKAPDAGGGAYLIP